MSVQEDDRQPRLSSVEISLGITLEDIPGGITCVSCGGPVEKTNIAFELAQDNIAFLVRAAPGYRCPADSIEYISHEALIETLQKAQQIMISQGNTTAATSIEEQIAFQKRFIK